MHSFSAPKIAKALGLLYGLALFSPALTHAGMGPGTCNARETRFFHDAYWDFYIAASQTCLSATKTCSLATNFAPLGPNPASSSWVLKEFIVRQSWPVIVGKAIEVSTREALTHHGLKDFAWASKPFGKVIKTLQGQGQDAYTVATVGIATIGAVCLRDKLEGKSLEPLLLGMVAAATLDQGLDAERIAPGTAFQAASDWVLDPIVLRLLKTGTRYAFEKQLQMQFAQSFPDFSIATALPFMTYFFSPKSMRSYSRAVPIGMSKMASGVVLAGTLSVINMCFDYFSDAPKMHGFSDRIFSVLSDAGIACLTTMFYAVAIPTTLTTLTPMGVVSVFVLGEVLVVWVIPHFYTVEP